MDVNRFPLQFMLGIGSIVLTVDALFISMAVSCVCVCVCVCVCMCVCACVCVCKCGEFHWKHTAITIIM